MSGKSICLCPRYKQRRSALHNYGEFHIAADKAAESLKHTNITFYARITAVHSENVQHICGFVILFAALTSLLDAWGTE